VSRPMGSTLWRMSIAESAARLLTGRLADDFGIEGCSESGISQVQKSFGISCPPSFRLAIQTMGRKCGSFLTGSEFLSPKILEMKKNAQDMLKYEKSTHELLPCDLVFWTHQGYQFTFLRCSGEEDPPVYHYSDEMREFRKTSEHFSDWLREAIEEEIRVGDM